MITSSLPLSQELASCFRSSPALSSVLHFCLPFFRAFLPFALPLSAPSHRYDVTSLRASRPVLSSLILRSFFQSYASSLSLGRIPFLPFRALPLGFFRPRSAMHLSSISTGLAAFPLRLSTPSRFPETSSDDLAFLLLPSDLSSVPFPYSPRPLRSRFLSA